MAEQIVAPQLVQLEGPDGQGVATLRFASGRPANSMTVAMVEHMLAGMRELGGRDDIRVLLIRGPAGIFSGGADLTMLADISEDDYVHYIATEFALFDAVERLNFVTIAAIDGVCLGNAAELALACDLRMATRGARFGLPETRIGFQGPVGRVSRYVGLGVAKLLLFSGDVLTAEQAVSHGLITWAAPDAEFESELRSRAAHFAALPPVALMETKRNLAASFPLADEQTANERNSSLRTFRTEDSVEGRLAFLQKRKAVFRGR